MPKTVCSARWIRIKSGREFPAIGPATSLETLPKLHWINVASIEDSKTVFGRHKSRKTVVFTQRWAWNGNTGTWDSQNDPLACPKESYHVVERYNYHAVPKSTST